MSNALRAVLAVALLSALPLAAYPVFFGGATPSGVDPFGHAWEFGTTGDGRASWGIPGLGAGVLGFGGPSSAKDFHIQFFSADGSPVEIDYVTPEGGPGGYNESTRFSNTSASLLWTRVADSASAVSFYAPLGAELDPGESFFVNITFLAGSAPVSFEAAWTGAAIPEPGTWALLLSGFAAVAALRLRKQKQ